MINSLVSWLLLVCGGAGDGEKTKHEPFSLRSILWLALGGSQPGMGYWTSAARYLLKDSKKKDQEG